MIINWPPALPQRVKYGASTILNSKGNRSVTNFEYGVKRMRRRFVNQPSRVNCQIFFKDIELETWNSFVQNTLKDGTRYFWFKIPVGNSMLDHRCRILNEDLAETHETYNYTSFNLELEVFERFQYSDVALWLLGEYGEEFVANEFADPLQIIINTTWPKVTENY